MSADRTIPEKVTPGVRYAVAVPHGRWDVADWQSEPCDCVGHVLGEHGEPYPDPACPACKGTGDDGVLSPYTAYPDLEEADARLLVFGADLLAACKAMDDLDCCDGYSFPAADWPKLWNALALARAAIARATAPLT